MRRSDLLGGMSVYALLNEPSFVGSFLLVIKLSNFMRLKFIDYDR